MLWIWIDTSYFVGAFDLSNNFFVIKAPPIAQWTVGKHIDWVLEHYNRKMVLNNWILFRDGMEVKF